MVASCRTTSAKMTPSGSPAETTTDGARYRPSTGIGAARLVPPQLGQAVREPAMTRARVGGGKSDPACDFGNRAPAADAKPGNRARPRRPCCRGFDLGHGSSWARCGAQDMDRCAEGNRRDRPRGEVTSRSPTAAAAMRSDLGTRAGAGGRISAAGRYRRRRLDNGAIATITPLRREGDDHFGADAQFRFEREGAAMEVGPGFSRSAA